MLVLDTNHLDVLIYDHERRDRFVARLVQVEREHDFVTTIINVQEKFAGWISNLNQVNISIQQQVLYYEKMIGLVHAFSELLILPFDETAAAQFEQLRMLGIRGKVTDLKIASIALCHNAIVLTANSQ